MAVNIIVMVAVMINQKIIKSIELNSGAMSFDIKQMKKETINGEIIS